MDSSLLEFVGLSVDEFGKLEEKVQEKLNIAFDALSNEATSLKDSLNAKGILEKSLHEKIVELEGECLLAKEKLCEKEVLLTSLEDKAALEFAEKEKLCSITDETKAVNSELEFAIRNLESEKEMLSEQLKHRIECCDSLRDEIKRLRFQAEEVQKEKIDLALKMEEINSKESSLKAQESRYSEETKSLQRHNDWLEERLRQTTDQLLTIRRDTFQKCSNLESELDLRKTELENANSVKETLEESVAKLTRANEDYIQKLKQVADEQIRLEQLYGNELEAQKQLVSLYKEQVNEAEEKHNELSEAVSSMQTMLKTAYETISCLENENLVIKTQSSEERQKLEVSLQQSTLELGRNKELLDKFRIDGLSEEDMRQLNPAVTATLTALKKGRSLTELYADYAQLVEDRNQLKLDKQRLTEYVKDLVEEVKEKAPMLRSQNEDYKRVQAELREVSQQLRSKSDMLIETEQGKKELERRANYYQRATIRMKHLSSDLSRQVQSLLHELEVSRGTVVDVTLADSRGEPHTDSTFDTSQLPDSSTMDASSISHLLDNISSAGKVIDEHLVTWRNLQELQAQNQRLLCVARDLANQLEKREQDEAETSKRISELSCRLETLSGELDVVRLAAREARAQEQLAIQQRNMYRSLLKRYDIEVTEEINSDVQLEANSSFGDDKPKEPSMNVRSSLSSVSENKANLAVERLEETLSSLQVEFQRYREDKTESDRIYTVTLDQVRKEASEARLLNQKLAAQLDFTHEKLRTMEANVSGYKQEITVLREMNARYSTSAAASEAELSRLRDDLVRASDKLASVEIDARNTARQLEVARAGETRWRQETESLHRQEQLHKQLMHQLEAIQGNLEEKDASERVSLERRVVQLETRLADAQTALSDATKASVSMKETLEHELEVARQNLRTERSESSCLQDRVSSLLAEVEELKQKKDLVQSVIETTSGDSLLTVPDEIRDSTLRVRELEMETERLRNSLDAAREQSNMLRDLAEQAEQRLNEVTEEYKGLEERMTSEVHETKQRCEFLETQLDLEKKERQNLVSENIRISEESHKSDAELRRELNSLQSQLDETNARCESALELEAGAKTEISNYERTAQDAREKYERELALHADDVKSLTEARRQIDTLRSELNHTQQKLSEAISKSESASQTLASESDLWDQERQELNDKLSQALKEQDLSQEQLIKLSQQIVSLRKVMEKPMPDKVSSSSESKEDEKSISDLKASEDLLQVISYLRRQKSIAQAACDASSAEVSRLLLRVTSLENDNKYLQTELERERKASELLADTSQRHSEIMERVEQLNLLTESNRLLRHERETLRSTLQQSEEQLASLQSVMNPLRDQNHNLLGQVDNLNSDKQSLQEERDRWKERCNRLVETAQRMDPEQYRLACNERDELQRKLRRTEEELNQHVTKLSELRSQFDQESKNHEAQVAEMLDSKQTLEVQLTEYSAECDSLRETVKDKDSTIEQLRQIGRKYRQDAMTLRRQVASSRYDEATLRSTNEALTEAKSDVVTLRADLSTLRGRYDEVGSNLSEAIQALNEYKDDEVLSSILSWIAIEQPVGDSETQPSSTSQSLLNALRQTFPCVIDEVRKLRQQADSQRERLLRMQLVESQLTKSLRDCAELRTRVVELQSLSSTSIDTQTTSQYMPVTVSIAVSSNNSIEVAEPHSLTSSQSRTPFPIPPSTSQDSDTPHCSENSVVVSESSTVSSASASTVVTVPAWVARAATAVQPVQPTPATTTLVLKQTAEIRPITSNVATVIPTPAPHVALTTSVTSANLPLFPHQASLFGAPTSALESSISPLTAGSQLLFRPSDQQTTLLATGLWGTQPRRSSPFAQAPLFSGSPATINPFQRQSTSITPSTMVSATGKRRHEDIGLASTFGVTEDNISQVPSEDRPFSPISTQPIFGTPSSKRLRPVAVSQGISTAPIFSASSNVPVATSSMVAIQPEIESRTTEEPATDTSNTSPLFVPSMALETISTEEGESVLYPSDSVFEHSYLQESEQGRPDVHSFDISADVRLEPERTQCMETSIVEDEHGEELDLSVTSSTSFLISEGVQPIDTIEQSHNLFDVNPDLHGQPTVISDIYQEQILVPSTIDEEETIAAENRMPTEDVCTKRSIDYEIEDYAEFDEVGDLNEDDGSVTQPYSEEEDDAGESPTHEQEYDSNEGSDDDGVDRIEGESEEGDEVIELSSDSGRSRSSAQDQEAPSELVMEETEGMVPAADENEDEEEAESGEVDEDGDPGTDDDHESDGTDVGESDAERDNDAELSVSKDQLVVDDVDTIGEQSEDGAKHLSHQSKLGLFTQPTSVHQSTIPTSHPLIFSTIASGTSGSLGLFGGFAASSTTNTGLFSGFSGTEASPSSSLFLLSPSVKPVSSPSKTVTTSSDLFKPSSLLPASHTTTASTKTSDVPPRPKIQPIIWDQAESSGTASVQPTVSSNMGRTGAARRKKWGPTPMSPSRLRRIPYGVSGPVSKPSSFGTGETSSRSGSGSGTIRPAPNPRRT